MLITRLCWVVELEQAGDLHGIIRWFKFILGVFVIIFWNYGWILLSYICLFILIVFNTCKHYIIYCDIDNWYCIGLLCWSKRVACMVL